MKLRSWKRSVLTNSIISVALSLTVAAVSQAATSGCGNMPIDITTDVCWECMYPMKLGGVTVLDGTLPDTESLNTNAICTCPTTVYPFVRIGLSFSFWEPARLIETVKTPYCFPALGQALNNPNPGSLQGSAQKNSDTSHGTVFAQAHYYVFPAMAFVSNIISTKCGGGGESLDLAHITEVDPMWNDEMTNLLMLPETLLFSNPYAVYACVADAVAVNVAGLPLNPLFWCMGSQGPVYPVAGHFNGENYVESNFALAERFIYKMARDWMICDPALDQCNCSTYPIWFKNHYRLQIAKPVKGWSCYPVGQTGMLWDSGKNPPFSANGNKTDNFLWVVFRKHECCVTYN